MHDDATAAVSPETGAMIDHILTNYHQMHRAGLASLVPLAERVEQVHADAQTSRRFLPVPWPRLRTRWKTT